MSAPIERLPPDWEQLATKTDLARLETRVGAVEARMDSLEATLATAVETLVAKLGAMEVRLERRAARDLRTVLFAFASFALAVMGMFTTILVSGVPAAG